MADASPVKFRTVDDHTLKTETTHIPLELLPLLHSICTPVCVYMNNTLCKCLNEMVVKTTTEGKQLYESFAQLYQLAVIKGR